MSLNNVQHLNATQINRWEDDESHTLSIGYLIRKIYWRNGYATEFAKEVVKFGLAELNPYQIVATVIPDHVASRWGLAKAGFSYSHNIPEWNQNLYAIKNPARAEELLGYEFGVLVNYKILEYLNKPKTQKDPGGRRGFLTSPSLPPQYAIFSTCTRL